ncbi:hypothetical protein [Nocardia sp. XZ_19_385]|nr:hypothetical protein [Nocardia sp. XZ_19_385]
MRGPFGVFGRKKNSPISAAPEIMKVSRMVAGLTVSPEAAGSAW